MPAIGGWLFSIGNYGYQRLLKPFHDLCMEVLKSIPMDGTFNQTAPLDRLTGADKVYSFDFKSATDRWPLALQVDFVKELFGNTFSSFIS